MSEQQASRRKFLKLLGLSTGATLVGTSVLASVIDSKEILKLTAEQQEFMLHYGKWMDDFIDVIHIQKKDAHNPDNQKRMIALTEIAEKWKPQLNEYMKDKTFSIVYRLSIERMKKEI